MYNRYVRNDSGAYYRTSGQQNDTSHHDYGEQERKKSPDSDPCPREGNSLLGGLFGKNGPLSAIVDKLKLSDLDAGDLLLLVLLILLFREGEDEELIIALGLLLIL